MLTTRTTDLEMSAQVLKNSGLTTVQVASPKAGSLYQSIKPKPLSQMSVMSNAIINKYVNTPNSLANKLKIHGNSMNILSNQGGMQLKNMGTSASRFVPVKRQNTNNSSVLLGLGKKIYTDPTLYSVKSLLDSMIKKIDANERKEKKKQDRLMTTLQKQKDQESMRLRSLLNERKSRLKLQILRKRELLEEITLHEIQKEIENELGLMRKKTEEANVMPVTNTELIIDTTQIQPKKDRKRERSLSEKQKKGGEPSKKKKKSITEVAPSNVQPAAVQAALSKAVGVKVEVKAEEVKLYCKCKQPYDDTKFYVGCELCNDWFHGTCVGISEDMALNIDEFICSECEKQKITVEEQELYCLCKQPYDESKFYVGCDFCQDWFHGTCVGITSVEADGIDEYRCPNCCKKSDRDFVELKPLSQKEIDGLKRLLRSLTSHKMAWPFMKPVNVNDVVDYYDKIKEPMDLGTMTEKLRQKKYITLTDFVADVSRIFDNCRYYNPIDSSFYRCAEVIENFFVQKLKGFKNTLKASKVERVQE